MMLTMSLEQKREHVEVETVGVKEKDACSQHALVVHPETLTHERVDEHQGEDEP